MACINCGHRFERNDIRGWYGPGSMYPHLSVGPFCERCYALIKAHEEPRAPATKRSRADERSRDRAEN
jgi:hypothetical protein